MVNGFSKRYHLKELVFYEAFESIKQAIAREKEIRGCSRIKKTVLIENTNPHWDNLLP